MKDWNPNVTWQTTLYYSNNHWKTISWYSCYLQIYLSYQSIVIWKCMLFTHKALNLISLGIPKGESIFVKEYSGLNKWKLENFGNEIDFLTDEYFD